MLELATWKTSKFKKSIKPIITINPWQIKFNHEFVKLLEKDNLEWSNYVNCFVDSEIHHLGFLFHNESDMECKLKITRQNHTFSISAYSLNKKYPWINEVAKCQNVKKRKFKPKKVDNLWLINLDGLNNTSDT